MEDLIEARRGADAALGVEWTELACLPARTPEDMIRVEQALTVHLCCEPGRCTWLRSKPYLRLRMAALYFPGVCKDEPITLFHQGLRVSLLDGRVAIARRDPSHLAFLSALEEIAVQDAESRLLCGVKRARGCG